MRAVAVAAVVVDGRMGWRCSWRRSMRDSKEDNGWRRWREGNGKKKGTQLTESTTKRVTGAMAADGVPVSRMGGWRWRKGAEGQTERQRDRGREGEK